MRDDFETVSGILRAKTARAALIDYDGTRGSGEVWTPLSLLSTESVREVQDAVTDDSLDLEVQAWFLRKEGVL